jgi:4-amino-4-deoxy-L-arabinose transferase
MLAGLALRLLTAADQFLYPWDEVFHAVVAKHIIQHPLTPTLYETPVLPYDYRNWTSNHIWLHKPPLPLWTMAASMAIFGINEFALRLPSVLLTTIGIYLTYYTGTYFSGRKTGYLAAFFYSINGLIIEMTGGRVPTDHTDIFFLFFVQLAVFFSILFVRKKSIAFNILTGVSIGLAILCKWLPGYTVLIIWMLLVMDSKIFSKRAILFHFLISIVISLCVFLPWQIYVHHAFPLEAAWESAYNVRHLTEPVERHGGSIFFYLEAMRIGNHDLIYLPIAWLIWWLWKNGADKKRLALFVWFAVPTLFFSVINSKMPGYILFTYPALFIITAQFWFELLKYRNGLPPENKRNIWIKAAISLLLLLLIALPVRYCIERVKPFKEQRKQQWVEDLKNMRQKNLTTGVLLNYPKPIDAMFYTDLTVYSSIPAQATIKDLLQRGYTVMINDNNKIPDEIAGTKGVILVHLTAPNASQ